MNNVTLPKVPEGKIKFKIVIDCEVDWNQFGDVVPVGFGQFFDPNRPCATLQDNLLNYTKINLQDVFGAKNYSLIDLETDREVLYAHRAIMKQINWEANNKGQIQSRSTLKGI